MICIFGCLMNEEGKKIKTEMLSWLNKNHNVFCVDVLPPNDKYEYPFIQKVLDCCIKINEPVLYLHTKGSGNKISKAWKLLSDMKFPFPKNAKPEDCQTIVRNMWKYEFTNNINSYIKAVNTNEPTVACPYTGDDKTTWQNGFVINPAAAKILIKTFHLDKNRYYYERMFNNLNINVVGLRLNNVQRDKMNQWNMWQDLWNNFLGK